MKSNKYQTKQTSFYYKELGLCYFYNGRNITKIKDTINDYKNNEKDNLWRYYDALISAYTDETEQIITEKLLLAFDEKYNLHELIVMIEKIPELKKKKMLYLVLYILNLEYKNHKASKLYLDIYLNQINKQSLEIETLNILSKRYNV